MLQTISPVSRLSVSLKLRMKFVSIFGADTAKGSKEAHFQNGLPVLAERSDAICQDEPVPLKIKDVAGTYIFKVDVGVLGEVWVSVSGSVIWSGAPAVPVLMFTTVRYDARLRGGEADYRTFYTE